MQNRVDKQNLMDTLAGWNDFLNRTVHLIACGGTAMTLMGIKFSTKDIDFIIPEENEHKYLIDILQDLGYKPVRGPGWQKENGFIFDLFRGKQIHTTELLESPLKEGNNIFLKEFSHIYLGVLNYYDLITSKLFRGTQCLTTIIFRVQRQLYFPLFSIIKEPLY